MQAEQQSERDRFEAWCREKYLCHEHSFARAPYEYAHTVSHRTISICYASVQMLWECWQARAALSHPSTPQGWKQIGWTCGDGDCGRIHEAPSADGSYAVPVYVQDPPEQGSKHADQA